ncbi:hypothetical protein TREES_T100009652 [Tupaia chinensis]|uniref:Uncharacterized protein n=1 Tax=Tupaia chinensis TaxID=246437 RepID=L9LC39_TUPCH|nr:hypothetical protein TREES_T100009652 [Tupaia chinensis]
MMSLPPLSKTPEDVWRKRNTRRKQGACLHATPDAELSSGRHRHKLGVDSGIRVVKDEQGFWAQTQTVVYGPVLIVLLTDTPDSGISHSNGNETGRSYEKRYEVDGAECGQMPFDVQSFDSSQVTLGIPANPGDTLDTGRAGRAEGSGRDSWKKQHQDKNGKPGVGGQAGSRACEVFSPEGNCEFENAVASTWDGEDTEEVDTQPDHTGPWPCTCSQFGMCSLVFHCVHVSSGLQLKRQRQETEPTAVGSREWAKGVDPDSRTSWGSDKDRKHRSIQVHSVGTERGPCNSAMTGGSAAPVTPKSWLDGVSFIAQGLRRPRYTGKDRQSHGQMEKRVGLLDLATPGTREQESVKLEGLVFSPHTLTGAQLQYFAGNVNDNSAKEPLKKAE